MMSVKKQQEAINQLLFPFALDHPATIRQIKSLFEDIDLFDPKYKYLKKKFRGGKVRRRSGRFKTSSMWYKNYRINSKVFSNKKDIALKTIICDGYIARTNHSDPHMFDNIEKEIVILAIRKLIIREIEDGSKT
jgi:hypothetical protein